MTTVITKSKLKRTLINSQDCQCQENNTMNNDDEDYDDDDAD